MQNGFHKYWNSIGNLVLIIVNDGRFFRMEFTQWMIKELTEAGISYVNYFLENYAKYKHSYKRIDEV